MPKQRFLILIILSLFFFIGCTGSVKPTPENATPATVITKTGAQGLAYEVLAVEIEKEILAETPSEISEFSVRVSQKRTLQGPLQYEWILPSETQVIDAGAVPLAGTLDVSSGAQQLNLRVQGFSKLNKQFIELKLSTKAVGQNIKRTLLFASQKHKTIEQQIQNRAHEEAEQSQQSGKPKPKNKFDPANVIK